MTMSHRLHAPDGLRPWARRLAGCLLAALLLATLAPAISRTLSAGQGAAPGVPPGDQWVELCTSQGMQWVRADLADAPAGDTPAPAPEALDLCGHCTLAAERFAPLIPSLPTLPAMSARWSPPPLVVSPAVGAPRRAAVARGPPLLS